LGLGRAGTWFFQKNLLKTTRKEYEIAREKERTQRKLHMMENKSPGRAREISGGGKK